MELTANLEVGQINWVLGRTAYTTWPTAIRNPPANGWGVALLFRKEELAFSPITFQGYPLFEYCHEFRSFTEIHPLTTKEKFCAFLLKQIKELGPENIDLLCTQKVFDELDLTLPFSNASGDVSGGKYPDARLKMFVKRHSRRGQALDLALQGKSIPQIMQELNATRRAVLSLFHQLHQYHGIGYTLYTNGFLSIQLPEADELWKPT